MPLPGRMRWFRRLTGRLIFRSVLSIFSIWVLLESRTLQADAGLFPALASAACLVLLAVDTFMTWRWEEQAEAGQRRAMKPLFAAVAVYVGVMYLIGFYISTALMLFALPRLIGDIDRRYVLLSGALVLAGIWFIFDTLLLIKLPGGALLP